MENFIYQKLVPFSIPLIPLGIALFRFKLMKLEKTFTAVLDFLLCAAVIGFSLIWTSTIYSQAYSLGGDLPADVVAVSNTVGVGLGITFIIFLYFIPFTRFSARVFSKIISKLKSIVFKKR